MIQTDCRRCLSLVAQPREDDQRSGITCREPAVSQQQQQQQQPPSLPTTTTTASASAQTLSLVLSIVLEGSIQMKPRLEEKGVALGPRTTSLSSARLARCPPIPTRERNARPLLSSPLPPRLPPSPFLSPLSTLLSPLSPLLFPHLPPALPPPPPPPPPPPSAVWGDGSRGEGVCWHTWLSFGHESDINIHTLDSPVPFLSFPFPIEQNEINHSLSQSLSSGMVVLPLSYVLLCPSLPPSSLWVLFPAKVPPALLGSRSALGRRLVLLFCFFFVFCFLFFGFSLFLLPFFVARIAGRIVSVKVLFILLLYTPPPTPPPAPRANHKTWDC